MRQIHSQEREQFKKLFEQQHMDRFEDRLAIMEIFLQTESHLTTDELVQLLEEKGYQFEIDFVMDTLKLMCRYGFAQKNRFDNGHVRYEHRHLCQHHDHMICTKCNQTIEFEDNQLERMQSEIASKFGFHLLQHKMELYGICNDCMQERMRVIPLSLTKQNERLVIKEFQGGTMVRMRLLSMGLRIGDPIEVVTNQQQGQVVISSDCKRYVLGRGLAQKVLVEPRQDEGLEEPVCEEEIEETSV